MRGTDQTDGCKGKPPRIPNQAWMHPRQGSSKGMTLCKQASGRDEEQERLCGGDLDPNTTTRCTKPASLSLQVCGSIDPFPTRSPTSVFRSPPVATVPRLHSKHLPCRSLAGDFLRAKSCTPFCCIVRSAWAERLQKPKLLH